MKNLLFTLFFISGFAFVGFALNDSSKVETVFIVIKESISQRPQIDENLFFEIKTIDSKNNSSSTKYNVFTSSDKISKHIEIKKHLDKWTNDGYSIKSSTCSSIESFILTTYYLTKKD